MTMHEALFFLDDLHQFLEAGVGNPHFAAEPGPWCWPTLEQVHLNLRVNRAAFPRDARVYDSFNTVFKIALRRHWTAKGHCQAGCKAEHLRLTAAGAEALRLMNEQGCGPQCSQHREINLHLERRAA